MSRGKAQGSTNRDVGDAVTSGQLSRGDVLRKGALAAGALYGLGALAPLASRAAVAPATLVKGGDVDILNYLLPFEYLQISIYNRILSEVNDKGEKLTLKPNQKTFYEGLFAEEAQHVEAMKSMIEELKGKPIDKGNYAFAFRYLETTFVLAGEIEGYAVDAYNYVIPRLKSAAARELAISIAQVDARHNATLQLHVKSPPAYYALDYGVSEQTSIFEIEKYTGPIIFKEEHLPGYENQASASEE